MLFHTTTKPFFYETVSQTGEEKCERYDHNLGTQFFFTSKGSYRSWKKIVKVWMMMMKERFFAGHPSLVKRKLKRLNAS